MERWLSWRRAEREADGEVRRRHVRVPGLALMALAGLDVIGGCAAKPPAASPATGTITVGINTAGQAVGSLTFTLAVGQQRYAVKADGGIVTLSDLPAGSYTVRLLLPSRCQSGENERRLTVRARRTTAVRFDVSCQ